jgi:hypothetical protein
MQVKHIVFRLQAKYQSHKFTVFDVAAFWKEKVGQYFAGVEECPICYSVKDDQSGALPRTSCAQCNAKFHGTCLYKWFKTSGNSTCPLCRHLF